MSHKTFMYTIPGNPQNVVKHKNVSHAIRDRYQEAKTKYQVNLVNQHEEESFITGPLHIDCRFIFDQRRAQMTYKNKTNYHRKFPTLGSLYGFIEHMMKGLLFDNEVLISRVSMVKVYGPEPKTEIIITKL